MAERRECDIEHLRDYPGCYEECGKDECDGVPVHPETNVAGHNEELRE